ncbi:type III-B CRISPR module RAMP protein Cmr4 [Candidatus Bathyarchaeota archaeon]|nr:type III-B CRISPR module RAMP protein Cmr4 [Candidatus Bathyarchaeota archaeon]
MKNKKMYWIHALSPLHVGTGRGMGFIDLPIAREMHTGWPFIPATSLKGAMRAKLEGNLKRKLLDIAFGSSGKDLANAGSVVFTDAKMSCLPVRSALGTFAYVTSPLVLNRINRDRIQGSGTKDPIEVPLVTNGKIVVAKNSVISLEGKKKENTKGVVYLDDFDLEVIEHANEWADFLADEIFDDSTWKTVFKRRFAIVGDDVFTFLSKTATEVNTRIRIDNEKGVVDKGALWYEEAAPVDSIFQGYAWCDKIHGKGKETHAGDLFTKVCPSEPISLLLGGNISTGKGWVRIKFTGDAKA